MGEQVAAGIPYYSSQLNTKKPKGESRGGVAQLGEHLPCKQGVKSSNLSISTVTGKTGHERTLKTAY